MRALALAIALVLMLAGTASAQEAGCAPVAVGDDTGVFFLVLSDRCTPDVAGGYDVIADLQQDDQPQELLVLVAGGSDQETRLVAQVLVNEVRAGSVDGHTWHAVTGQAVAAPGDAGQPAEPVDAGQPVAEPAMGDQPAMEQPAPAETEPAPQPPADSGA